MRQIITTYFVVVALLALGFFGVGALAKAAEPHEYPHQERPVAYDIPMKILAISDEVFGSLDYVQRGIQATISLDPS